MIELIEKKSAIHNILGEPTDLHYPSWYASVIEKMNGTKFLEVRNIPIEVDKAIKLLCNERECVETDACDHKCGDCMLSGDKDEIVDALDLAIVTLKKLSSMEVSND